MSEEALLRPSETFSRAPDKTGPAGQTRAKEGGEFDPAPKRNSWVSDQDSQGMATRTGTSSAAGSSARGPRVGSAQQHAPAEDAALPVLRTATPPSARESP